MDRRAFLQLSMAVAAAGSAAQGAGQARKAKRPNVVHIVPHDLGAELGCYGHPDIRSPRLDQLAAEGVRFTKYFCVSTACSPARGAMMTGRYAHTNGLLGLAHLGWSLPKNELTFVDYFNEAGYETVHAGLQHERVMRRDNRYQVYLPGHETHANSGPGTYCEEACAEAIRYLQSAPEKPFYLNMAFFEVHAPWNKREQYKQYKYDPKDVLLPPHVIDSPGTRHAFSQFYSSISFMDACVGKVLDTLRETGLEGDTIVIFTTDHGRSFPRAKTTMYDAGTNIALIMRWPGVLGKGVTFDPMVQSVDLLPTTLELAGLPIDERIQGRSCASGLLGKPYQPHEIIFMERNSHEDLDFQRAARTTRYKYIRNFTKRTRWTIPSDNPPQDLHWFMLRESGVPRPHEQLYDLEKDPNEFNDVGADRAYASVLEELRRAVENWMYDTNDFMRGCYDFPHDPQKDPQYQILQIELLRAQEELKALRK